MKHTQLQGEILQEVGEVPISDTQKIRVLVVRKLDGTVIISNQKWWRASTNDDWSVGKGFELSAEQSTSLGSLLSSSGVLVSQYK